MMSRPLLCVVGARPNFMKMAPMLRAFEAHRDLPRAMLVHTGQHYDASLNDGYSSISSCPTPDVNLGVGSGSHASQTAEVMKRFEPVLDEYDPCCVIVVGDVNSTLGLQPGRGRRRVCRSRTSRRGCEVTIEPCRKK